MRPSPHSSPFPSSNNELLAFRNQRYLCLETYRKTGAPVRTPVAFVQRDAALFALTQVTSAKVKRLRNNSRVRVAPSDARGEPLAEWVEATAVLMDEAQTAQVRRSILAKYRFIWRSLEWMIATRAFLGRRPTPRWVGLQITFSGRKL